MNLANYHKPTERQIREGVRPSVAGAGKDSRDKSNSNTSSKRTSRQSDFHSRPCRYTQGYSQTEYACNVYMFGEGDAGMLGDETRQYAPRSNGLDWEPSTMPVFVRGLDQMRVRQVVCRLRYVLVLTVDGQVYSWGSAFFRTLGHGRRPTADYVTKPTRISTFPNRIVYIAANDFHAAAIDEMGKLYTWGSNEHGALGHGSNSASHQHEDAPREVQFFSDKGLQVKLVACGLRHSIALTTDGEVYSWGDNNSKLLGLGVDPPMALQAIVRQPRPIDVLHNRRTCFISAGNYHSCAVTEDGDLLTWGAGEYGQLGHNETKDMYYPKVVRGLGARPIVYVACGYFTTAAVTAEGKVYCWGNNIFGQLGLGPEAVGEVVRLPTLVRSLASKQTRMVSLGNAHMAIVTESGELYTCGRATGGVLGRLITTKSGLSTKPGHVEALNGISVASVSCGWSNTGVLTVPLDSIHSILPNGSTMEQPTEPEAEQRFEWPTFADSQQRAVQLNNSKRPASRRLAFDGARSGKEAQTEQFFDYSADEFEGEDDMFPPPPPVVDPGDLGDSLTIKGLSEDEDGDEESEQPWQPQADVAQSRVLQTTIQDSTPGRQDQQLPARSTPIQIPGASEEPLFRPSSSVGTTKAEKQEQLNAIQNRIAQLQQDIERKRSFIEQNKQQRTMSKGSIAAQDL